MLVFSAGKVDEDHNGAIDLLEQSAQTILQDLHTAASYLVVICRDSDIANIGIVIIDNYCSRPMIIVMAVIIVMILLVLHPIDNYCNL